MLHLMRRTTMVRCARPVAAPCFSRTAVPARLFSSSDAPSKPSSPKVDQVLKDIGALNFFEVVELISKLKTMLNIPQGMSLAPAPAAAAGASPAAAAGSAKAAEPAAAAKPAQTAFDVKLDGFEVADKIKVIKEVRAITGLGLKEAKELVESAPKVVASGLAKADADAMVEKLKAAGAKITLV